MRMDGARDRGGEWMEGWSCGEIVQVGGAFGGVKRFVVSIKPLRGGSHG